MLLQVWNALGCLVFGFCSENACRNLIYHRTKRNNSVFGGIIALVDVLDGELIADCLYDSICSYIPMRFLELDYVLFFVVWQQNHVFRNFNIHSEFCIFRQFGT